MTSYYTETHRPSRKHHLPAIVRRYPVHRVPHAVPVPNPAPAAPTKASIEEPPKEEQKEKTKEKTKQEKPKEKPKEEKPKEKVEEKAASEPAPEWSAWQRLEGGQWDGYWRAKAREDSMCCSSCSCS